MEGVHLRGASVARGGIRWSDRPDDFRTEVGGLVKTQMVKNAVIVPGGSKGGFVPLRHLADSEAMAEEGKDHISPFDHLMITIPREDRSQRLIRPRGYNFVAFGPDGEEVVLSKESITSPVRVTRRTGAEVFEDFLQEVEDELAAKRGDDE
jgi:glutamate dehydrogenase